MVKIYTTNWCPSCISAKRLFQDEAIEFEEINIEEIDMSREELYDLAGKYTVPQIFINEKCIGGYDQLLFLYQNKELHSLVNGK